MNEPLCKCGCGRPATPGHKGLRRACYLRRWHAEHPGRARAYRERHRDRIRAYNTAYQRARRARLRGAAA